MNNRKQGLKVLGLSLLAALGLMAFGASAASASGSFLIAGLSGLWEASVTGEGENLLEGRFWILGLNVEISCHAASVTEAKINTHGHAHATLTFSNCLASGTNADGTLKGSICKLTNSIVAKVLGLVVLHNSKPYVLFTPLTGEAFASVNGAPCLPSATVKGSAVVSISNPDGDDVQKLISTKGMLTLFTNDKLFYGINEAHLEADAKVELSGVHEDLAWGAV